MAKRMPKEVADYLRKLGQTYGKLGGKGCREEHDARGTLCTG